MTPPRFLGSCINLPEKEQLRIKATVDIDKKIPKLMEEVASETGS